MVEGLGDDSMRKRRAKRKPEFKKENIPSDAIVKCFIDLRGLCIERHTWHRDGKNYGVEYEVKR